MHNSPSRDLSWRVFDISSGEQTPPAPHLIGPPAQPFVRTPLAEPPTNRDLEKSGIVRAIERVIPDKKERVVLMLHYVDGLTNVEIAKVLDTTLCEVDDLYSSARIKARTVLERYGKL